MGWSTSAFVGHRRDPIRPEGGRHAEAHDRGVGLFSSVFTVSPRLDHSRETQRSIL